jgi:hypothetical protein
METRKFTREFKLEAVRLITERGVSYAQAASDLGVRASVLRNWVKRGLSFFIHRLGLRRAGWTPISAAVPWCWTGLAPHATAAFSGFVCAPGKQSTIEGGL